MDITNILGYAAAFLVLLTFSMKTMVRLRIIGIVSNLFFISYGYLGHAYPVMFLHIILLPLNIFRLVQILSLNRKVDAATRGDPDMEWLKSVTSHRILNAGEYLFRRGDKANSMIFVLSGALQIEGLGVDVGTGDIVGEIGLLAPDRTRTQTIVCTAQSEVLEITYDQVKTLYFQSPKFGFYLLQLAGRRLLENIERLERAAKQRAAAPAGTV
jgi:hypothetical protein